MVLKSLRLFLLYQIWDMPLCLCMSRKTNVGRMDRERGEAVKVVSVLCVRGPGQHVGGDLCTEQEAQQTQWVYLWCNRLIMELYVLIEHKVRGKVKHPAVDVFVGPPSQGKHHHSHPRMLDDSHLIVHVEVSETWVAWILLSVHLSRYCSVFATRNTIIKLVVNKVFD